MIYFQPISNLFCVVKSGLVDPCKVVPMKVYNLMLVGDKPTFFQGSFPKKLFTTRAKIVVLVWILRSIYIVQQI
jgi:hypothetical protein